MLCAGKYCDYDEAVASGELGVVIAQTCPLGFFCPRGTNYSTENPCPPGKYGSQAGLGSEDDCSACDGGRQSYNSLGYSTTRPARF